MDAGAGAVALLAHGLREVEREGCDLGCGGGECGEELAAQGDRGVPGEGGEVRGALEDVGHVRVDLLDAAVAEQAFFAHEVLHLLLGHDGAAGVGVNDLFVREEGAVVEEGDLVLLPAAAEAEGLCPPLELGTVGFAVQRGEQVREVGVGEAVGVVGTQRDGFVEEGLDDPFHALRDACETGNVPRLELHHVRICA